MVSFLRKKERFLDNWQQIEIMDKFFNYEEGLGGEPDVCEYFDKGIMDCRWVDKVATELSGKYYRGDTVIIDRMIRTKCGNYVGVEIKAAGSKFGRPLAQIIDYTNSVFGSKCHIRFPDDGWMSTFPMAEKFSGPLQSVVAQNRIANFSGEFILTFESKIIAEPDDEELRFLPQPKKVGSR